MITSLTKPISIKRDGDNYQYLSQGKLEYVRPQFFSSDYIDNVDDPVTFALLPSGMIYVSGSFFVTVEDATYPILTVPPGFNPVKEMYFSILRITNGDIFPSTVRFDLGIMTIGQVDPIFFPIGRYVICGIQYVPETTLTN